MRVWEPLKLEEDSLTLLQIKNNATMIKRINLKTLILVEVVCCKFWGLKAWGRRMYRLQHSFSYHDLFDLWLNEKKNYWFALSKSKSMESFLTKE